MKKLLLSAATVLSGFCAFGQQDYQFSQWMFDRLSINPGYAGIDNKICATGIFRNQWSGFTGAPNTFLMNIHGPVPMARGGVGLSIYSDKIGFFNNFTARLSYSYHQPVGNTGGLLGIGVSVGLMNVSLNPSWIAITPADLDDAIPNNGGATSDNAIDFGFGLYYRSPTFYAGISATHLSESDLTDLNVQNARHYFVIAGYDKQMGEIMLRPGIRVEADGTSTQADINFNVLWKSMVWGGLSYRISDAVIPMVGFQQAVGTSGKMPGMVRIGYSYDVTTSEIKNYSSGSHEIMLSYCFNVVIPPTVTKSKTVRFL